MDFCYIDSVGDGHGASIDLPPANDKNAIGGGEFARYLKCLLQVAGPDHARRWLMLGNRVREHYVGPSWQYAWQGLPGFAPHDEGGPHGELFETS